MTIVNYLTGLFWVLAAFGFLCCAAAANIKDDAHASNLLGLFGLIFAIPSAAWLIARYLL